MRQLWAPWRMSYVGGDDAAHHDGCFLCDAGGEPGTATALVVHRTELAITLLNRYPYSSGHLLVIPRRHVPDLLDLSGEEASALMAETSRAVLILRRSMHPEGFNVGLNLGPAAGASVEHVHVHVVPRWAGDTNFMPVLADVKVLPQHLEAAAELLRAAFAGAAGA